MQADRVKRRKHQKCSSKAQPPAGEPAPCRLDVAGPAVLNDADDPGETDQLAAFSAPTAKPACSIIL